MTSTTSQHQEYNFQQTRCSSSQFYEPNNKELLPRENTGYDTSAKGDSNIPYLNIKQVVYEKRYIFQS